MQSLWPIIANTPIWVWPLLAALLFLGARQMATRTMRWRGLFALPAALAALSLSNLLSHDLPALQGAGLWLGALLVGAAPGWSLAPRALRYDPAAKLVTVPGSILPLLIIVAIFIGRYYFGYLFARYPELRHDPATLMASVGFGGFCAGLMAGRLAAMWRRAHSR